MTQHTRQTGFTLIEILVAITISLVVIFIVNQIFADTSKAVGAGTALSNMMHNARGIGEQLAEDARWVKGPSINPAGGGFIVIRNKVISDGNTRWKLPDGTEPTTSTAGRAVRSDELLIILEKYSQGGFRSVTPSSTATFEPSYASPFARLWLGHVSPTVTGTDGGANPGPLVNRWILGRQLMLLNNGTDPTGAHAASLAATSGVTGFSGNLHHGVTDVCDDLLGDINVELVGGYSATAQSYLPGTSPNIMRVRTAYPTADITSEQLAQSHTFFGSYVSDFMVEFAGDYDGTAGVDRNGSNEIIWYSHIPDAALNVSSPPTGSNGFNDGAFATSPISDSGNGVVVFRHDDAGSTSRWPYLIRIRYRLHDRESRLQLSDTEPGRWLEQIIPIHVDGR